MVLLKTRSKHLHLTVKILPHEGNEGQADERTEADRQQRPNPPGVRYCRFCRWKQQRHVIGCHAILHYFCIQEIIVSLNPYQT